MSLKRFSLKTLLSAITLLCLFLGYRYNWIRQREQFLRDEELALLAAWGNANAEYEWQFNDALNSLNHEHDRDLLGWLLRGYGKPRLTVLIPYGDIERLGTGSDGMYAYMAHSRNSEHYRTAKHLFPESRISAIYFVDNKHIIPVVIVK